MQPFRLRSAASLVAVVAFGCRADDGLPTPVVSGEGFFDRPWPSDTRMVDGHLDLDGFPKRGQIALVDTYIELAESLDGFGTNAPLYVRLDADLREDLLPTIEDSRDPAGGLFLVDIDPDSPERGARVPITWTWDDAATDWKPDHLLAVQPVWGFPLRPRTTYALVLGSSAFQAPDDFAEVWSLEHPDHAHYAPLLEVLPGLGLGPDDVALATVFTTQDPTAAMTAIAADIHDELDTPSLNQTVVKWGENGWFAAYTGTMQVPLWQHGEKPYLASGGGFAFDEAGQPELYTWETVEFTFTIPLDEDEPAGGWPVVINAHGTGGDHRSHASPITERLSPAAVQARHGMAMFAISMPLHADRGTGADPTLTSFNYLNPESARCTFRQGALDQVYLAEILAARAHCFTTDDGRSACTDPDRVAYLGHSQGGITGAMAVPYFDRRVKAAVLSGAGGGLSVTLVERPTEEVDVGAILREQLEFDADEELSLTHPLVGLVQLLSEVTDPLNYSPYWHDNEPSWENRPVHVLMTEGLEDEYTPPSTTEALASAAGIPVLDPVSSASLALTLRGLDGQPIPTVGNTLGFDGTDITTGLSQYPGQGHFPIFDDADAAELYAHFLATAMRGEPEIGVVE